MLRFTIAAAIAVAPLAFRPAQATGADAEVSIAIFSTASNPAQPRMGDRIGFSTVISNDGAVPIDGLIAWISLVQTDPGKEQPVDLEDWSAHKAITESSLAPGQSVTTDWPIRLIQPGHYRVVVSAASRSGMRLAASPFADFDVQARPVVESGRVLPVALGVPLLLGSLAVLRRRPSEVAPRNPAGKA